MIVEGINLTSEMIDNIKWFQGNAGVMDSNLKTFDEAISFIAKENDSVGQEKAAQALRLISSLCSIKGMFASLEGKEVQDGL